MFMQSLMAPLPKGINAAKPDVPKITVEPRRIAAFDIDGTLVNTPEIAINYARNVMKASFDPDLYRTGGIERAFPKLTKPQLHRALSHSWSNLDTISLLNPKTQQIFDELRRDKWEIALLTASRGEDRQIRKYFDEKAKVTYDYFMHVGGREEKAAAPVSFIVDDSRRTAKVFGERGKPFIWFSKDSDPQIVAEILAYKSVFSVYDIDQVPEMVRTNERFLKLLRSGSN